MADQPTTSTNGQAVGDTSELHGHDLPESKAMSVDAPSSNGETVDVKTQVGRREPITADDIVVVRGRYLFRQNTGERFFVKGMAFPVPVPGSKGKFFDTRGWNAVLDQIANDMPELNTVRVYELECHHDHSAFLEHAAELGLYVMVPLTASSGPGVLDRNGAAPKCYPEKLYKYGKVCIDQFSRHPNVIGGLVGNEVMNSPPTWVSAPCLYSYTRDLKQYQIRQLWKEDRQRKNGKKNVVDRHYIPLIYASQHDASLVGGPAMMPAEAMHITMNVLTCKTGTEFQENYMLPPHAGGNGQAADSDSPVLTPTALSLLSPAIDIFGVNIESWCSSEQQFKYNPDGVSFSSYYTLYNELVNVSSIPLLFTEMGCARCDFNKGNGLEPQGYRDWGQVSVVLDEMAPLFSGFCAYAYDGNPDFRMMDDKAEGWDGHHTLDPSDDYEAFRKQLAATADQSHAKTMSVSSFESVDCDGVWQHVADVSGTNIYPVSRMPSYHKTIAEKVRSPKLLLCVFIIMPLIVFLVVWGVVRNMRKKQQQQQQQSGSAAALDENYSKQSVNTISHSSSASSSLSSESMKLEAGRGQDYQSIPQSE